mmetsp:Transcript_28753/g.62580  ORF Transcript_28753/g.62580 Transcript_28753/m.62580 type:complete len:671 (-) Transcript_28753:226-2238(-)|eukprot:CAMPEP_0206462466 /NCGR_PEP_ID=MMETSP0324_2-20121206/25997_1 /ASSEMBLY_ACC=CAM_ASM_000836 /TAXON_ID=2866 /ORGANISM="Crypthecodinium cohnii, Strain Seligo" /LENGTH=670 /DNA_ID=CAMNT_0053934631 /DNA_START=67 /DNA_END=2079 /DNA_ORIENTATION=-
MPRFVSTKKNEPLRAAKEESGHISADVPTVSMSDTELKARRKVKLLGHEVKVPWKRKHHSHHESNHDGGAESGDQHHYWAEAALRNGSDASPEPTPRSLSSSATAAGGGGGVNKYSKSGSQPLEEPVKISKVIQDTLHLSAVGASEVARMQARIDDMWAEEVVLGCECEIFGAIRAAALTVQAGAQEDAAAAVREAALAAAEAEAAALQTVRSRLAARDCVLFEGGLEGLQTRLKRRIRETQSGIQPYIQLLQDRDRAHEVVRIMDRLLREAQEEYANVNSMKTAKSEVVLELQDKASEKEWLQKQLALVLDNFEASSLLTLEGTSQDFEDFFRATVSGGCEANCSLRQRAVRCLEQIRQLGNAATSALATLTSVEVDDTDSGHAPEQSSVLLPCPARQPLQPQAGIEPASKSFPSRLEAAAAAAAEAIALDSKSHVSQGSPISLSSMTAAPSPSKSASEQPPHSHREVDDDEAEEDDMEEEVVENEEKEKKEGKDRDEEQIKEEELEEKGNVEKEKDPKDEEPPLVGETPEKEKGEGQPAEGCHEKENESKADDRVGKDRQCDDAGEHGTSLPGRYDAGHTSATGSTSPRCTAEHPPTAAFLAPTSRNPNSSAVLPTAETTPQYQRISMAAASPAGSPPALSMSAISYDCLDDDEEASEECRDTVPNFR